MLYFPFVKYNDFFYTWKRYTACTDPQVHNKLKSLFCCCLNCLPSVQGEFFFSLFLPCLFWQGFLIVYDGVRVAAVAKHLSRHTKRGVTCPTHFQLETIGLLHGTTFLITSEKCYQHCLCQSKYRVFNLCFVFISFSFNRVHVPKLQFTQQLVLIRCVLLQ